MHYEVNVNSHVDQVQLYVVQKTHYSPISNQNDIAVPQVDTQEDAAVGSFRN